MSDEETTEYHRISDHALEERVKLDGVSTLINLFDFNTEQITTLQRSIYWRTGHESITGNVETQTLRQNFNEVAPRAIKFAHKKLVELGGNPPPLEECLPSTDVPKKKTGGPLKLD